MAVKKFTQEIKVKVSAKRMYKAYVTDAHKVMPKLLPNHVKSIDNHGDGGPGTVRQTNFAAGSPYSCMKHRIEGIDVGNYMSKFTLIEGPILGDKIEKVCYDQKFEDTSDGGCLIKIAMEYHTKGNVQLKEEDIKADKDEAAGFAKLTEESLLAHPDVCV